MKIRLRGPRHLHEARKILTTSIQEDTTVSITAPSGETQTYRPRKHASGRMYLGLVIRALTKSKEVTVADLSEVRTTHPEKG